jgi:hypothetical protein
MVGRQEPIYVVGVEGKYDQRSGEISVMWVALEGLPVGHGRASPELRYKSRGYDMRVVT